MVYLKDTNDHYSHLWVLKHKLAFQIVIYKIVVQYMCVA